LGKEFKAFFLYPIIDMEDTKKMPKNAEKYTCETCAFKCSKKSNYAAHVSTAKHQNGLKRYKMIQNDTKKMPKNAEDVYDCECGKSYKYHSGLWRHQSHNKCCASNTNINEEQTNETDSNGLANLVLEVVKQNKDLTSQNQDLTNKILEICKNGTNNTNTMITNNNSNNKTFNLNVFLNEQCKDAMNIMEFVESVKIQFADLESVGKLGFVEGISSIIVKNLKAMDIHKRPVHCSDSKREVMYIKDEDKWEKENEDKHKLRKVIKHIAQKNSKMIPEFKSKYPDCVYSDSIKSDQYNKLVIESMGGKGDNDSEKEDKIIKKLAKEILIDK
jgi:hypothetical protein